MVLPYVGVCLGGAEESFLAFIEIGGRWGQRKGHVIQSGMCDSDRWPPSTKNRAVVA